MSDDDYDDEELREAEALARALDRGHAADGLPEEALQTAALIRHSAGGSALRPDREAAVLEEVLAAAEKAAARRPDGRPSGWRWALGLLTGAVAVAVLMLVLRPAPEPTSLPSPTAALVSAQIDRLQGDDAGFHGAMRAYRGDVYAALEDRYAR